MNKKDYSKFRKLYKEFLNPIYNFVFYRTGKNHALAEDLVSEIFLKAYEKFESFNPKTASFRSWIYSIARNHIIDYYRVSKPEVSLDEISDVIGETQNYNKKIAHKKLITNVKSKLNDLPEAYKDIIILKYFRDLDNKEIGAILDKEPGAVRVTIHRAISALKKKL